MKTLSTLFAIALCATTATACKKTPQEKQAPATKPTEGELKKEDKPAPVTPDKPGDKAQDKPAPVTPDKPGEKAQDKPATPAATGN